MGQDAVGYAEVGSAETALTHTESTTNPRLVPGRSVRVR